MNGLFANPSLVGLAIQAVGVLMISARSLIMGTTLDRAPLRVWTTAWASLFIALVALLLAFAFPRAMPVAQPLYLFGEYVFGYLLFAGCREYVTGRKIGKKDAPMALAALVPAIGLPVIGHFDFNAFYSFHAVLYSYLFFMSFRALREARPNVRNRPGLRVLRGALLLLAINYLHYAPVFGLAAAGVIAREPAYLAYVPFYDLILLVLLSYGMVMAVTGDMQHELEQARDRLARIAQQDHLTSALNRHAFYSVVQGELSGTAVIADIDNLKSVNDQFGHYAGDAAIRAVASAIRSCIRADDLLFRWGGDEFLILLLGVTESGARARLAGVNERLRDVGIPGGDGTATVSISMGYAGFDSAESLDDVIRVADSAMYGTKKKIVP
jgi:diguanylate cyclase (GGDEF)-like protein